MGDFGCCARQGGHDVPDPFDAALKGAIRENRRLRGEVAELQAVIAAVQTYLNPNPDGVPLTDLYAVRKLIASVPSDVLAARDAQVKADTRKLIAAEIRRACTPSHEAYTKGGDSLIYAVADWVENPPEWVRGTGTPNGEQ